MVFHFENASNAFRLYHARGNLIRNIAITGHFGFEVEENPGRQKIRFIAASSFSKALFSICFAYTRKRKADVLKFLRIEEGFRKASFS